MSASPATGASWSSPAAPPTCSKARNGTCDVFRRDLYTGTTILISRVSSTGAVGEGCSDDPVSDYQGDEIAFLTKAANLGASGGHTAAVVWSETGATVTLASRAEGASGTPASDDVGAVAISGDGSTVAFTSASNLATGVETKGVAQVWARNLDTDATTLISAETGSATAAATTVAGEPSLDEFATHIAFTTSAKLTSTATGAIKQVYVREPGAKATVLASLSAGDAVANSGAGEPSIAAMGTAVAFSSNATNLGPDASGQTDIYVRSLKNGTITTADTTANGATIANAPASHPSLSAHGNIVAFASAAENLGAGTGGHQQIWVRDLGRGLTTLASPATGGATGGNGDSTEPTLAQGGIAVGFLSSSSNLDPADTDTTPDAYVHRVRVEVPPAQYSTEAISLDGLDGRTNAAQPSGKSGTASRVYVSGNGLDAAFDLTAPLAGEATGFGAGVFVRDLASGELERVNRASDSGGLPGAELGARERGRRSDLDQRRRPLRRILRRGQRLPLPAGLPA